MSKQRPFRLGVLGSGLGSNFDSIAQGCAAGAIPAEIALVLSDVEDSGILSSAQTSGVPWRFIAPGGFRTKLDEAAESEYIAALQEAEVDLVVLAGFMRILKGEFLNIYEGRVVNIHPSLLPSFPGLEAWKQALDHGVKVTGCTVHFVDQGVDTGAIIAQGIVNVEDGDSSESLREKVQEAEHRVYPAAIASIAQGEIELRGRRTYRRIDT